MGPQWALTQGLLADFPGDPLAPAAAAYAPLTILNLTGPSPSLGSCMQAPSCGCWPTPDLLAYARQARPLRPVHTCGQIPQRVEGRKGAAGRRRARLVAVITDPEMLLLLWRAWRRGRFTPSQMHSPAAKRFLMPCFNFLGFLI